METYRERIYGSYLVPRERARPITLDSFRTQEPYLIQLIRNHLPANHQADILDLGCGHGTFLHFCQRAGYVNARGVDCSGQQVEKARELGIRGVSEGDLVETLHGLPDASQDVIVTFDVIEHLTKEELIPVVDEVHRALRPGGRWIIHVPNGESPFHGRIRYGDFTHEQIFTRQSLAQVLLASGFGEVRTFEDRPVIHGLKSLVRRCLWTVIRGVLLVYTAAETGSLDRGTILSQNLLAVARKAD